MLQFHQRQYIGDSDVTSSYRIYVTCFLTMICGNLSKKFLIVTSLWTVSFTKWINFIQIMQQLFTT